MEKFLLLGGNGFIGSHILDILLREKKSVKIFDKNPEAYRKPFERVEYIQSSFSDTMALTEALTGVDCVIHALSTSVPSTSNKFPIGDVEGNLINSINLLDMMVSQGIQRIVFLSSGGTVYGIPKDLPVSENHPTNPICSHGIIKLAIEKYLLMYSELYHLKPMVLRISNPFGPRQSHLGTQGFIATMINNFIKNEVTTIFGDGKIVRDYIYVTDVARACYMAAISDNTGIYNVGFGLGLSLNEVIELFEDIAGRKINKKYLDQRKFDVPEIVLEIEKIKSTLGWKPEIPIKDALRTHLDWWKEIHKAGMGK